MIRGHLRMALVIGALTLGACSDSTGSGDEFGTYTLVSVNGKALPTTIIDSTANGESVKDVWTSGSLKLDAGSTWRVILNQTITINGVSATTPDTSTGSWTRAGNTFTLTSSNAGDQPVSATLSGRDLTITATILDFSLTVVADFRR